MTDTGSWILPLIVLVPFVSGCVIAFLDRHPDIREGVSLLAALLTFLLCVSVLPSAFSADPLATPPLAVLPGLSLHLYADALALLFACLSSGLWIVTTVYNIGYMRGKNEHAQTRYYACFAITIGAVMGVALSSNIFSLFVFYEILAIAAYPLVVHTETSEALAAGRKYLIYTQGGGIAILVGMMTLLGMGSPLDFIAGGNPGIGALAPEFARLAFLFLFIGFGVKAAIVPLHGWLPSAMVAPTPVSGLLHAVAVVNTGVFGLMRLILYVYGPEMMVSLGLREPVIAVSVITIIVGALLALRQDDFKLRLAYSTVSQLSYMVLGIAIFLPAATGGVSGSWKLAAIIGAMYAFVAHALGKLTMFFVAGTVAVETGRTKISELDGLGRKMPWEFLAFTLAALSMAGLPPMAGFIAKWYLSVGIGSGYSGEWWMLLVLVAASVLNLAYFLPVVMRAFLSPCNTAVPAVRRTLRGPVVVTAAATLLAGIWTVVPASPLALCTRVAEVVTGTTAAIPAAILVPGSSLPPFIIFLAGAPLVLALRGRARQAGLVLLGALGLVDALLLPTGISQWNIPFMSYTLTLLRVDSLSYLVGAIFAAITFFAILYAAAAAPARLHLFALLYAGCAFGVVFAGDWITLLIFWELMAITSTFLIWQEGGEAVAAGFRYLLYHCLGGTLLAAGIALLLLGGSSPVVGQIVALPGDAYAFWASVFILAGIGVNIAAIPLHTWLPDAYPRANFIASVFLCVYTTKAAVYLLARVQPGMEFIAFMGAIMAVYGVAFAVFQNDMRRLLSYHIISQVGYMVAGIGIIGMLGAGDPVAQLGFNGGMAHLVNNILYKTLLFMAVGVIIWKTGENLLSRVGGLQKRMPVTAFAFWVAAFAIAGVPLLNGFISKGMILAAAEHTSVWIWALLEIAAFGTALSFLKLGYFAFLREGKSPVPEGVSDPPVLMQAGMLMIVALCVLIGVYPQALYAYLPAPVEYAAFDPAYVLSALVVLVAAVAFFFTIGKKILEPHDTRLADVDTVYVAGANGVVAFAGALQELFGRIYGYITEAARLLFAAGRIAMRWEDRDAGGNIALFAGSIVALMVIIALGAFL